MRGQCKENVALLISTALHQVTDELCQSVTLFYLAKDLSSLLGAGLRTKRVSRETPAAYE